jgi:hypothetical protein
VIGGTDGALLLGTAVGTLVAQELVEESAGVTRFLSRTHQQLHQHGVGEVVGVYVREIFRIKELEESGTWKSFPHPCELSTCRNT